MDTYTESKIDNRESVTVIGLGMLGSTLAGAFLKGGHPTTVWNRSGEKAAPIVNKGATRAATAAEAVSASRLVVVCVSDHEAVREILDPIGDALSGRVLVNLSSGTPKQSRETAAWAAARGADYLDGAAMSGTRLVGQPEAVFLYSGSPAAFTTHQPMLTSLGAATHLGADPGLASLYDTALFGMNWGVLSGFFHAVALVGTEEVDATAFASVATGYLPFVSGLLTDLARQIEDIRYPSDDGTLEVHAAAMDHLIHTSRANGIGTGVPDLIKALLERGIAAGHGADGTASLVEVIRKPAPAARQARANVTAGEFHRETRTGNLLVPADQALCRLTSPPRHNPKPIHGSEE